MKNLIIIIIIVITVAVVLFSGDDDASQSTSSAFAAQDIPADCKEGAQVTGKKHNVIGSGINVRIGPGANYDKVVNQKATDILKSTQYISIDDTTVVFEECTKGEWSWIRVLEPDWLQNSHRGWVISNSLDKGEDIGGYPYARKISSLALSPYDAKNYPKTIKKYGARLKEIEQLRRKAAEMAVDSGKCDMVTFVELSDSRSSIKHLHFSIDCRNLERIRLDEFEIIKKINIRTEKEKSWSVEQAYSSCIEGIKKNSLFPLEVRISKMGNVTNKNPITHIVNIVINFDTKNEFGVKIGYVANCNFEPGINGKIDIQRQQ